MTLVLQVSDHKKKQQKKCKNNKPRKRCRLIITSNSSKSYIYLTLYIGLNMTRETYQIQNTYLQVSNGAARRQLLFLKIIIIIINRDLHGTYTISFFFFVFFWPFQTQVNTPEQTKIIIIGYLPPGIDCALALIYQPHLVAHACCNK